MNATTKSSAMTPACRPLWIESAPSEASTEFVLSILIGFSSGFCRTLASSSHSAAVMLPP